MSTFKNTWRPKLPLPTEINPSYFDVCLTIPDDDEYRQLLLGKLYELATWTNYDRNVDKTATLVAKVWLTTIQSLIESDPCMTICIRYRNSTTNPCIVQVSCDDGVTWNDAWDMCQDVTPPTPTQSYDDNGHLIYTYPDGHSENADMHDPRFNSPTTQGQIGTDAVCRAAENIRDQFKNARNQIEQALSLAAGFFGLMAVISGIIVLFVTGFAALPLLISLCGVILGLDSAVFHAQVSDAVLEDFKCIVYCELKNNVPETPVTVSSANFDRIQQAIRDTWADVIPRTFFLVFTQATGPKGLQNMSVAGANDGASCADCPSCADVWCYEFDFTVSDQGFTTYTNAFLTANSLAGGEYMGGEGWQMTQVPGYPNTRHTLAIHFGDMPDLSQLQTVEWFYYYSGLEVHSLHGYIGEFDIDGSSGNQHVEDLEQQSPGGPTEHYQVMNISPALTGNLFTAGIAQDYGTVGILRKLRLRGTGTNPFGADNC